MKTYPLIETNWTNYHVTGVDYHLMELQHVISTYGGTKDPDRYHAQLVFELVPEPDNEYDPHAISVRKDNILLGYIKAGDTQNYLPALNRIRASGLIPTVSGELWYYPQSSSGGIALRLEEPECLIPVNDPPPGECFFIPPSKTLKLSDSGDHFDTLFDYLPPSGEGKLLLTLTPELSNKPGKAPRVAATLDGEVIGHLSPATSKKVLPIIEHFDDEGVTICALGTLTGSSLSAEVTVQLTYAHELDDLQLEESVGELNRLLEERPDPSLYDVPVLVCAEDFDAPSQNSYQPVAATAINFTARPITKQEPPEQLDTLHEHSDAPKSRVHITVGKPQVPNSPEEENVDQPALTPSAPPENRTRKFFRICLAVLVGFIATTVSFIVVALVNPSNELVVFLLLLVCIGAGIVASITFYRHKMKANTR